MAACRLSILAMTLSALVLLVTNTFAYRTTITTVEIDGSRKQSQQCQEEIQMQDMKHCQKYVMQQSRRGGGGGNVLAMTTDDSTSGDKQSEHFKPCCQELKKLDEQCQCPALAQIVQQHMQEGEKLQHVAEKLQNLPQRCQVGSQRCHIQGSVRWF